MKPIIGLAVIALLSPCGRAAGAQLPDSLTVHQAVERVLATHPAVQAANSGVSAAAARVQERQTAFDPTVVAEGSYSRVGPVPTLRFDTLSFALFPANNYLADVTLRHTLYDWGRRSAAVSEARSLEKTASENVEVVKSRLAYAAVDAFYGVLFLQQNLKVQDDEIQALTQHLDIARNKVRAGTATNFDVLSTQVRIATAQSQRVDIANALDQRSIELRQLMGLKPDQPVQPVGGWPEGAPDLNLDSLTTVALAQRPDLQMSRNAVAAAEVRTRMASLSDRPSVALDLSFGAKNGYVPQLNLIRANWIAGVSVRVPVYNGHLASKQVRESQADVSAARSRTEDVARGVSADVQKAVVAVRASLQKIRTGDVQVREAHAALDLARTRYQAGVVTNLDILDAETLLAQAELVQLRARYELVQSRYMLRQAVGDRIW